MSAEPPPDNDLWKFEPLADFRAPSMPTQETLRKKFVQLVKRVRPSKSVSAEVNGALESAPLTVLDRAAPSPGLEPFHAALDVLVDEWLALEEPKNRLMVIVVPPCLDFDLMGTWVEGRQAERAMEPSREAIISGDLTSLPNLEGDTLMVIPEMARWYCRHRSGLALIRELISRLSETKRRCVIGVSSWAWTYLAQAADAAVELPAPLTLAPFDDLALCSWLSDLAESAGSRNVIFRRDVSGEVVFDPADHCSTACTSKSGNGRSDFLKRLAAISRGNPFLAWHLFRSSMRVIPAQTGADLAAESARADSREIVWIDAVSEVSLPDLPKAVRASALMVFHALLLHGELDQEELRDVLPPINVTHVLHRLTAEHLLLIRDGRWRVSPVAYPAVRDALAHAGFPIDPL